MKRVVGFALFFIALGMIINYFVNAFWEFVIIVLCLLLAYLLFCK